MNSCLKRTEQKQQDPGPFFFLDQNSILDRILFWTPSTMHKTTFLSFDHDGTFHWLIYLVKNKLVQMR